MSGRRQQFLEEFAAPDSLPTVPAVAVEILRLSNDPDVSIEAMAGVLQRDPALAGRTLKFANSSYYGGNGRVATLQQALVRLGLRAARLLALSFSLVDTCRASANSQFDYPAFWHRTLATSVAARRIATVSVRRFADQAFTGGMLCDIGCPILARRMPEDYGRVQILVRTTQLTVAQAEQRVLGLNHAEVGSLLFEHWRLPEDLVAAVGGHHDPARLGADTDAHSVAVVLMAASELADILTRGSTEQRVNHLAKLFRQYFSFQPAHLDTVLKDVVSEVRQLGAVLNVKTPPASQLESQARSHMLRVAMENSAGEPGGENLLDVPGGG